MFNSNNFLSEDNFSSFIDGRISNSGEFLASPGITDLMCGLSDCRGTQTGFLLSVIYFFALIFSLSFILLK